jgi:hypothetical protein
MVHNNVKYFKLTFLYINETYISRRAVFMWVWWNSSGWGGAGNYSLHHRVQNGSGAHPASYPMGTRGSFPGGKAAGAWSWPLTSICQRMSGGIHPLTQYAFMAWCSVKVRDNFTFTFHLVWGSDWQESIKSKFAIWLLVWRPVPYLVEIISVVSEVIHSDKWYGQGSQFQF